MNLYYYLYPHFFHPILKIIQMCQVIITVILSIDRYVVVFYPYIIYRLFYKCYFCKIFKIIYLSVHGCFRTLLRGPKRKHISAYIFLIFGLSKYFSTFSINFFLAMSTLICIPHFLEYGTSNADNGEIIVEMDPTLSGNYYYQLIYYSILEPLFRSPFSE